MLSTAKKTIVTVKPAISAGSVRRSSLDLATISPSEPRSEVDRCYPEPTVSRCRPTFVPTALGTTPRPDTTGLGGLAVAFREVPGIPAPEEEVPRSYRWRS